MVKTRWVYAFGGGSADGSAALMTRGHPDGPAGAWTGQGSGRQGLAWGGGSARPRLVTGAKPKVIGYSPMLMSLKL